jgi:hypothetical protein
VPPMEWLVEDISPPLSVGEYFYFFIVVCVIANFENENFIRESKLEYLFE